MLPKVLSDCLSVCLVGGCDAQFLVVGGGGGLVSKRTIWQMTGSANCFRGLLLRMNSMRWGMSPAFAACSCRSGLIRSKLNRQGNICFCMSYCCSKWCEDGVFWSAGVFWGEEGGGRAKRTICISEVKEDDESKPTSLGIAWALDIGSRVRESMVSVLSIRKTLSKSRALRFSIFSTRGPRAEAIRSFTCGTEKTLVCHCCLACWGEGVGGRKGGWRFE